MPFCLGLDFGTESVRAILVDARSGATMATSVDRYADGVIEHALPGTVVTLGTDWALQNPADWLDGLARTVAGVLSASGVDPADVIGLGVDFTSCTVLPTDARGRPLCQIDGLVNQPHAWPKLWKHHAAQPQADRVTELAAESGERWLPRYGGRISSEWMLPKALQVLEEAPEIYRRAAHVLEGGDWIVWQLTGTLTRNACAAGYKGLWHRREGYPSRAYLAALDPASSASTRRGPPVPSPRPARSPDSCPRSGPGASGSGPTWRSQCQSLTRMRRYSAAASARRGRCSSSWAPRRAIC